MSEQRNLIAASILHELRQPVQSIRGFLAIVLAERVGPLTEVQQDFLSTANRAAIRLERLLQDINVMERRMEDFPLALEAFNFHTSVEACLAELQPMTMDLSTAFIVETRSPEKLEVLADPSRIDQILLNLLENALRYGDPSEPIRVHLRGGSTRVLCIIENAIADEARQQNPDEWFHPYTRQCGANKQFYPDGQGLGLSVVARLVEAHHGRILARMTSERVYLGFVLPRDGQSSFLEMDEGTVEDARPPDAYSAAV